MDAEQRWVFPGHSLLLTSFGLTEGQAVGVPMGPVALVDHLCPNVEKNSVSLLLLLNLSAVVSAMAHATFLRVSQQGR